MASICFRYLIIGIITDIKIILCDENVNVFPFLYAYFLDNCETPPTLLSIVQNKKTTVTFSGQLLSFISCIISIMPFFFSLQLLLLLQAGYPCRKSD